MNYLNLAFVVIIFILTFNYANGDDDETNSKKLSNLEKKPEHLSDDVKFIKLYQKLRAKAMACIPQKFVPKDKCSECSCLLPGVLLCTKKSCLSEERKHRLLNGVVFN